MTECFSLEGVNSRHLRASNIQEDFDEFPVCSVDPRHIVWQRSDDLVLELKHSKRDQWLIHSLWDGVVVHAELAAEFEKRGFTGYALRPATVHFRDGFVSRDYSKLIVTGSAGEASPDSGMIVLEECSVCGYKKYDSLQHPEKLIDWSQWDGADFFTFRPYANYTLITKRVADALEEVQVKSYRIESLQTVAQKIAEDPGFTHDPNLDELLKRAERVDSSSLEHRHGALAEFFQLARC